jgi:hypothetical protein
MAINYRVICFMIIIFMCFNEFLKLAFMVNLETYENSPLFLLHRFFFHTIQNYSAIRIPDGKDFKIFPLMGDKGMISRSSSTWLIFHTSFSIFYYLIISYQFLLKKERFNKFLLLLHHIFIITIMFNMTSFSDIHENIAIWINTFTMSILMFLSRFPDSDQCRYIYLIIISVPVIFGNIIQLSFFYPNWWIQYYE